MTDGTDLCISCGLCCNGSLFHVARFSKKDDVNHWAAQGFELIEREGSQLFYQSCPKLDGRKCSIYKQPRPSICGKFRCTVLRKVQTGKLSPETAMELVRTAVSLTEKVHEGLKKCDITPKRNFQETRQFLTRRLQEIDDRQQKKLISETLLNIYSFKEYTNHHFLKRRRKTQKLD